MAIVQWVNLEKKDIYALDNDIYSKDRCGKLTVKAIFDKNNVPIVFKTKVTPVGNGNAVYTKDEEKRNSNFKMTRGTLGQATTTQSIIEEIQLPAAGGNTYKVEAKDANNVVVLSVEVETKRKLYYQVLIMDDANGSTTAYSLAPMETHSLKHFIKLQKVGAEGKVPYRKTININGNIRSFGNDVTNAFNIDPDHKKVGIATVFTDYISGMGPSEFRQNVVIGKVNPQMTISASDVIIVGANFLWHGLDDADDAAKKWFRNGEVKYTDPINGNTRTYTIKKANVEIVGTASFKYGGYNQIKIKRDAGLDALLNQKYGILEFVLFVNIASAWINGFSWNPGGGDLITCAKRVVWDDMPTNTQEYTWNHEVGHRFGMVAYGDKLDHTGSAISGSTKLPDGPSTFYYDVSDNKNYGGHRGPHCSKGATYNVITDRWSGIPNCVMFGANGIGNSHSPKEYCVNCDPIVRKLDLS